jgi:hypothetical protein
VCVCVLNFVHWKSRHNEFLHSDKQCCLQCSIWLWLHVKEVYNLFCYLSTIVTHVKDSFSGYSEIEIGDSG